MGGTNVVPGTVVEALEGALRIDTAPGELALPAACATGGAVRAGQSVGICFWPEHVLVGDAIEALAHLPQGLAAEPGAALPVGVRRGSFVVLPERPERR